MDVVQHKDKIKANASLASNLFDMHKHNCTAVKITNGNTDMGLCNMSIDLVLYDNIYYWDIAKLGKMAAKIASHNYDPRYETLFVVNLVNLIAVEVFFKFYELALSVKKGKFIPSNVRPHVAQFVIIGHGSEELINTLSWLVDKKYDNTANFVIVCASSNFEECDQNAMFRTLAELYIPNVVYLKLDNKYVPEAYTLTPLQAHSCWNQDPVKLNVSYDCPNEDCYKELFLNKFLNFHKCPIKVSTFQQAPYMYLQNTSSGIEIVGGGDGEILKLLTTLLNATLVIVIPPEGADWGHFENNNWTGSLGDIFNNRAHIAMCATVLTTAKNGNFQISLAYDSMDMSWAAASPALKPTWEKLLYPLPVYLRIILLLMFIVIIFLNSFTKTKVWANIVKVLRINNWKSNLLLYSWIIFLGMPVEKLPQRLPFRILVFSWLWYCTIIRVVYQGTLIGYLKIKATENSLQNFSEVLENGYPYGGFASLSEYYREDPEVYENWNYIKISEAHDVLDNISLGSDFVFAHTKDIIIEHFVKYNGTRRVQIIPEKIVNSPKVMYFRKYSNLKLAVDKTLTVIVEGGFTHRLYAQYNAEVKKLFNENKSQPAQALRMVHFTGCAILLIIGWILSSIFFSIEVACGRIVK